MMLFSALTDAQIVPTKTASIIEDHGETDE